MLALVVTRGVSPWLPDALRALAASRRAPERVVVAVVDPGAVVAVSTLCQESGLAHADVVPAAGAATFGAAARAVLDRFPATRNQWLWLLHDDAAPTPTALTAQLAAVEQAQSVVIVGAKNVEWNAPDELISVGVGMTPSGRRFTAMEESEIDQGQYDDRSDVLAVPLAGALVRRDVWDALGGPDPALGPYGDGADLTRRARLAGHRVVVAPRAVVRHARASYLSLRSPEHGPPGPSAEPDTERSWAARRQAVLHSRLAGTSGVGFVLHRELGLQFVKLNARAQQIRPILHIGAMHNDHIGSRLRIGEYPHADALICSSSQRGREFPARNEVGGDNIDRT
ncbi:MAG: glycosyltransferase [Salana multivorans]|nr:glycosyltransferase [Salana multivorans]